MVTGDVTGFVIIDFSGCVAEGVPYRNTFAVAVICTLNLIGTCCSAPYKIFWKIHIVSSILSELYKFFYKTAVTSYFLIFSSYGIIFPSTDFPLTISDFRPFCEPEELSMWILYSAPRKVLFTLNSFM